MPPNKNTITSWPVGLLLEELLGPLDFVELQHWDSAFLLQLAEEDTDVLHVEMPGEVRQLDMPIVWRKPAWLNAKIRFDDMKNVSNLERKVNNIQTEKVKEIIEGLQDKLGLDKKAAIKYALKMLNKPKLAATLGLASFEDLESARALLQEYQEGKK